MQGVTKIELYGYLYRLLVKFVHHTEGAFTCKDDLTTLFVIKLGMYRLICPLLLCCIRVKFDSKLFGTENNNSITYLYSFILFMFCLSMVLFNFLSFGIFQF